MSCLILRSALENMLSMTVSIPKAAFKEFFVNEVASILTFMQTASGGKIYLPTEVSESIVMPHQDVLVTFRDSNHINHIPLNTWFTSRNIN